MKNKIAKTQTKVKYYEMAFAYLVSAKPAACRRQSTMM